MPTTPARIQRRRTKGWRAPLDAQGRRPVYVGRGTRWGNPARVTVARDANGRRVGWTVCDPATGRYGRTHRDQTAARAEAAAHYRAWLERQPALMAAARIDLAGRDLACWCPLPAEGEPDHCHAAVLLAAAAAGEVA